MYDDLTLWHVVVSRFVNKDAFIEDGTVFVPSAIGPQAIPLFDSAIVISLMNYNPHLMEAVSQAWKYDEDRIERAFTIKVFEQYMDEEFFRSQVALFDPEMAKKIKITGEDGLKRIIDALHDFEQNAKQQDLFPSPNA